MFYFEQAERDHAKASLIHMRAELEEARSNVSSTLGQQSGDHKRFTMLQDDINTVSEALESALGGGLSNTAVRPYDKPPCSCDMRCNICIARLTFLV
jgi:hypothetical protein